MNRIYVNVTEEQHAALKKQAEFNGDSIAGVIRRLVANHVRPLTAEDRIAKLKTIVAVDEYEIRQLAARGLRDLDLEQHLDDGKVLLARLERELATSLANGEDAKNALTRVALRAAEKGTL